MSDDEDDVVRSDAPNKDAVGMAPPWEEGTGGDAPEEPEPSPVVEEEKDQPEQPGAGAETPPKPQRKRSEKE